MPAERENQRFLGFQITGGQRRGSRLYGILTDAGGKSRGNVEPVDLEDTAPSAVRDEILRTASRISLGPNDTVVGVGLVIGGIVIHEKIIKQAPAFGERWKNQRLVHDLEPHLQAMFGNDVKVVAANDANALAVDEQRFPGGEGELVGRNNFAVILLNDTGIGCGLFLSDDLYTGGKGEAGELGHIKAVNSDVVCNCGRTGCLEAVATLAGMTQRVSAGADRAAVWEEGGRALGFGLSALINLMNPEALLIYGQNDTTGVPRSFHIDNANQFDDNSYLRAMVREIHDHVPADAASDCLVVVRTDKELPGPRAAAAVAIRAFLRRPNA